MKNITLNDGVTIPAIEFGTFRIPADGTYQMKNINGMEVLVPDIQQNAAMLQEFINNTRSNQDDAAPAEGEEANHMGVVESPPVQSE